MRKLFTAVDAIASLGVRLVAPTAAIARNAARYLALDVSLADGFAIATAQTHGADLASFDQRVRRALPHAGVELSLYPPFGVEPGRPHGSSGRPADTQ